MAQVELDPQFVQGLRLLHSTNKDSADQLRVILDEVIRQKHGTSKMLSNILHKKVQKDLNRRCELISTHKSTNRIINYNQTFLFQPNHKSKNQNLFTLEQVDNHNCNCSTWWKNKSWATTAVAETEEEAAAAKRAKARRPPPNPPASPARAIPQK